MTPTKGDLAVSALVALAIVGAYCGQTIFRAASPTYATWRALPIAVNESDTMGTGLKADWCIRKVEATGTLYVGPKDGWGRPFHFLRRQGFDRVEVYVYSTGPNGIDESGGGDDIVLDGNDPYRDRDHFLGVELPWLVGFLAAAHALIRVARAPRARRLHWNLVAAAVLAAAVTVVIVAVLHATTGESDLAIFMPIHPILGLPPIAHAAAVAFLIFFAAAALYRLNQDPTPDAPTAAAAATEKPSSRWRWTAVICLGALALSLAATGSWLERRRAANASRDSLLIAGQLGLSRTISELLKGGQPELVQALLAQPPGVIDFAAFGEDALAVLAKSDQDVLPAMIASLEVATGHSSRDRWTSWNYVCTHDPHFEALLRAIATAPRGRLNHVVLSAPTYFAAVAGRDRTIELLAGLLEDRTPFWQDRGEKQRIPRICDEARSDLERILGGPEHRFGVNWGEVAQPQEAVDEALERARAWWRSRDTNPPLAPAGWIVLHATNVSGNHAYLWIEGKDGTHFASPLVHAGEDFEAEGPFEPGSRELVFTITNSGSQLTRTVSLTIPADGAARIDVDFATGRVRAGAP